MNVLILMALVSQCGPPGCPPQFPGFPANTVRLLPSRPAHREAERIPFAVPGPTTAVSSPVPVATAKPAPRMSDVVGATDGKLLPRFQVDGMTWNPGMKQGIQPSNHPESQRFAESLVSSKVETMPDDSGRFRILLVGDDESKRKAAIEDFKRGVNKSLGDQVSLRSCKADGWEAKTVGLKPLSGLDMIVQDPSGKVVYQLVDYTAKKGAEALRTVNPAFDPTQVPGVKSSLPFGLKEEDLPTIAGIVVVLAVVCLSVPKKPK